MPDSTTSTNLTPAANILLTTGEIDPALPTTELRMADGRVLRVPTSLLHQEPQPGADKTDALAAGDPGQQRLAIVEERMHVTRQTVPTSTVRLHKTVETFSAALDEPLAVRTFDIERILLNQVVEAAPAVRMEGETTIYPIVEEQAVVTKRIVLKEEIRVTRRDTERRDQQTVILRREHVEIERESRG